MKIFFLFGFLVAEFSLGLLGVYVGLSCSFFLSLRLSLVLFISHPFNDISNDFWFCLLFMIYCFHVYIC